MTTTAQYREMARNAEKRLAWAEASRLWLVAVHHYPVGGSLAKMDCDRMRQRAADCHREACAETVWNEKTARQRIGGTFGS